MKSNYYNFKKYKDKYLLTNEEGKYIFLSKKSFIIWFTESIISWKRVYLSD